MPLTDVCFTLIRELDLPAEVGTLEPLRHGPDITTRTTAFGPKAGTGARPAQLGARAGSLCPVVGVDVHVLRCQVAAPGRRGRVAAAQIDADDDLVLLHLLVQRPLVELEDLTPFE